MTIKVEVSQHPSTLLKVNGWGFKGYRTEHGFPIVHFGHTREV